MISLGENTRKSQDFCVFLRIEWKGVLNFSDRDDGKQKS